MANTVIALKKSGTPSAIPVDLANGELAINYADGKLYYKAANGTILSISGGGGSSSNSFATVNANGTLVVADSSTDILTLEPGTNISIVGDAVNDKVTVGLQTDITLTSVNATSVVKGGTLSATQSDGAEGGQIDLAASKTSTLTGDIAIDIYNDRIRFFEKGGTNRGAFIELTAASSGVGSNLLSGGTPSSEDTTARAAASAAFDKANSANYFAYLVNANTVAAFQKANAAGIATVNVSETGPTSPTVGNLWWNSNTGKLLIYYTDVDATSQWVEAYGAGGGTETGQIASAFNQANAAYNQANSAFNEANTAESIAISAYNAANNAGGVTVGKAIAMAIVFGG